LRPDVLGIDLNRVESYEMTHLTAGRNIREVAVLGEYFSLRKPPLRSAAAIPAAFAGLGLHIACAADLAAIAPPTGVNWDGIYAGLHGGIAEGSASWSVPTGAFARFPTDVAGRGAHEGLFGGVQLGYNRQFGATVVGIEGDVSFGPLDSNTNCGATVGFGGTGDPCHARTNLMASITGLSAMRWGASCIMARSAEPLPTNITTS
jgi:hypothetical protein